MRFFCLSAVFAVVALLLPSFGFAALPIDLDAAGITAADLETDVILKGLLLFAVMLIGTRVVPGVVRRLIMG